MFIKTNVLLPCLFRFAILFAAICPITAQPIGETLPKVMLIGENEAAFEQMQMEYQQTLLDACHNNFDSAYTAWVDALGSMERYSEQIGYDLKGVKLWLYIFFDKDGSIKHIAYYLRPNSRNVNTAELTAFFSSYMNRYRIGVDNDKKFSHYGTVSFPMLPQQLSDK